MNAILCMHNANIHLIERARGEKNAPKPESKKMKCKTRSVHLSCIVVCDFYFLNFGFRLLLASNKLISKYEVSRKHDKR